MTGGMNISRLLTDVNSCQPRMNSELWSLSAVDSFCVVSTSVGSLTIVVPILDKAAIYSTLNGLAFEFC
jgi:hypothetical protein